MGVKKSLAIAQLLHDVLPAESDEVVAEDSDDVPAEADN